MDVIEGAASQSYREVLAEKTEIRGVGDRGTRIEGGFECE
jgi:hypothetical protein